MVPNYINIAIEENYYTQLKPTKLKNDILRHLARKWSVPIPLSIYIYMAMKSDT